MKHREVLNGAFFEGIYNITKLVMMVWQEMMVFLELVAFVRGGGGLILEQQWVGMLSKL